MLYRVLVWWKSSGVEPFVVLVVKRWFCSLEKVGCWFCAGILSESLNNVLGMKRPVHMLYF